MKLNLSRPATYQIKVPGHIKQKWSEIANAMSIAVENDEDGLPITILTGIMDQAALQGLLRRLYNLRLPLISVICLNVP